jgi:ribosomal protein L17
MTPAERNSSHRHANLNLLQDITQNQVAAQQIKNTLAQIQENLNLTMLAAGGKQNSFKVSKVNIESIRDISKFKNTFNSINAVNGNN